MRPVTKTIVMVVLLMLTGSISAFAQASGYSPAATRAWASHTTVSISGSVAASTSRKAASSYSRSMLSIFSTGQIYWGSTISWERPALLLGAIGSRPVRPMRQTHRG
jgi:hypothetical protein